MNERIAELYKQATRIEEPNGLFPREEFNPEKFVALIVRECCDVLYDNELGGYQVNYVLKEHFGVEE